MQIDSPNVNTINIECSNNLISKSNQESRQPNTDTNKVENNDEKQTGKQKNCNQNSKFIPK